MLGAFGLYLQHPTAKQYWSSLLESVSYVAINLDILAKLVKITVFD